jgi:hypothetical protein
LNKTTRILFLAAGLISGTAAVAREYDDYSYRRRPAYGIEGPYVGFSLGAVQYREEGLDSLSPGVGLLRLGVPVSRNLAIEGRAGGGLGNSSRNGYTMSVDSIYAAYIKGSLPLSPAFSLYAVGGVAGVDFRRDFGFGASRETGASFGVGADFNLGGGTGINFEWTRLPSGSNAGYDFTNSMATLGATWHF